MEVDIFARIASGFYARSLDSLRVEGEAGIIQATSLPVPRNSNTLLFPEFSGRGYASLNYSQSQNVIVQWVFPSIPTLSEYQITFIYSSHDHRNRRRSVTIIQDGISYGARVTFLANCLACKAYLSSSDANEIAERANFTLTQSMVTLLVSFSAVDISLDAIVAIPRALFNPTSLGDPSLFLATCDIISRMFM